LEQVVVNLHKLVMFSGQLVEHDFQIKCDALSLHGNSFESNGTLRLVLRLVEGSELGQEFDLAALKSIAATVSPCFLL